MRNDFSLNYKCNIIIIIFSFGPFVMIPGILNRTHDPTFIFFFLCFVLVLEIKYRTWTFVNYKIKTDTKTDCDMLIESQKNALNRQVKRILHRFPKRLECSWFRFSAWSPRDNFHFLQHPDCNPLQQYARSRFSKSCVRSLH